MDQNIGIIFLSLLIGCVIGFEVGKYTATKKIQEFLNQIGNEMQQAAQKQTEDREKKKKEAQEAMEKLAEIMEKMEKLKTAAPKNEKEAYLRHLAEEQTDIGAISKTKE